MSPVTPDAGGPVVIPKVRPPNAEGQSYNAPANMARQFIGCFNVELTVLGTTQIFAGILLLSVGIVVRTVESRIDGPGIMTLSGTPIWTGILFTISGCLSVSKGKVTASLVMNILSSLFAVSGVIISAQDVGGEHSYIPEYRRWIYRAYYNNDPQYRGSFTPWPAEKGLAWYVFLLYALMMCITISLSMLACRTVCRRSSRETSAVINQTPTVNVPDTTREDPPDYATVMMSDSVVIYQTQTVSVSDTTRDDPPDYSASMKSD